MLFEVNNFAIRTWNVVLVVECRFVSETVVFVSEICCLIAEDCSVLGINSFTFRTSTIQYSARSARLMVAHSGQINLEIRIAVLHRNGFLREQRHFFEPDRKIPECSGVLKVKPDKVVRWCPDGDFWRLFGSCIFSEPHAAHFRPAF